MKLKPKDDIISPLAHKNTIKVYTENMNKSIKNNEKNISQEKIDLFIDDQLNNCIDVVKKEHPNKEIILVGHSMGGILACHLASKYKEVKNNKYAMDAIDFIENRSKRGIGSAKNAE